MSPYNAYSSSLSSSSRSSYTPSSKYSGSSGYSSSISSSSTFPPSTYNKPPAYSSSLSSKYRSPSTYYSSYSSPSTFSSSTLNRNLSSSYLSDKFSKCNSISSYSNAISSNSSTLSDCKYKTLSDVSSDSLYRSPSISLPRRKSSASLSSASSDRSPRPSLPNYSSISEDILAEPSESPSSSGHGHSLALGPQQVFSASPRARSRSGTEGMKRRKYVVKDQSQGEYRALFLAVITFLNDALQALLRTVLEALRSPTVILVVAVLMTTVYVVYATNTRIKVSFHRKSPVRYKSASKWSTSTDDEDDKVGVRVGLTNLGNTCFMNAVLQCLCHTPKLVEYCTRDSYLGDINDKSPTRGDLMKVFADFVKKISESKARSSISTHDLRREVRRYAPRFLGDSQQDSQEFLRYLLQGLHDDINRVKRRRNSILTSDLGGDSVGSWRRYKITDDSLIVDLFGGQLKSSLKCTVCSNESITYDPFWDLSLPLPEGSRRVSLRQCFELFSAPEFLEGANAPFCERCKKKTRSSKKMEVNRFPEILVIHLKRFSATCYGQKLNAVVDCPMTLSNFADVASQNASSLSYSLYGVVDHDGSNNSGHYTAKCRNPTTKEWCEFNDQSVTSCTATSNIVTYKAYILFYIKDGGYRW